MQYKIPNKYAIQNPHNFQCLTQGITIMPFLMSHKTTLYLYSFFFQPLVSNMTLEHGRGVKLMSKLHITA